MLSSTRESFSERHQCVVREMTTVGELRYNFGRLDAAETSPVAGAITSAVCPRIRSNNDDS